MTRKSRRQFLEESMLASAAAVVATSTHRLSADDSASSSANERLGVACVGVRGRGGSHLNFFSGRKDTEVVAIVDVDEEVLANRAKQVGNRQGREPKRYVDLRKALDDPRIDIVTIATPNHWHSLAAIWAIQAGKDVYLEKPVSHNVSEGRRVVEAARKYNKICQTGTQSRSNPGMRAAIAHVQKGGIGTIRVARGLCYKRRKSIGARGKYDIPKNIHYNLWLGPAPEAPLTRPRLHYDWHWQWAYGNGDLGNQGIHQMDIARWGMGVSSLCKSVFSYGGRLGYKDAGETANTQVVVHDYGDQSLVFEVRGLETGPLTRSSSGVEFQSGKYRPKIGVIFEGSDGYVVIPSYAGGAAFDLEGKLVEEFKGPGSDAHHFANFLTAVRSRNVSDLNADIEEGHLSSALCHLGNISYRLGGMVPVREVASRLSQVSSRDNDLDTFERMLEHLKANGLSLDRLELQAGPALAFNPKSETFVDHEAADRMLTRHYRAPFVVPAAGQV